MADEKEPLERMADAFESIASELKSIRWQIESHSEAVGNAGRWITDGLDNVAAATRGEVAPERYP